MVELNRTFPFIHFNGVKRPEQAFPDALKEIDDFSIFVQKQKCPSCKDTKSLHLNTFERLSVARKVGKAQYGVTVAYRASSTTVASMLSGCRYQENKRRRKSDYRLQDRD